MNSQIMKGKWTDFKGEMRKLWGDLTNSELEQTKGNVQSIKGLLQQKYGKMKDEAKAGFDDLIHRYGEESKDQTTKAKKMLREDVQRNR